MAKKRVFTRKGFPSLPPRRCVSNRHAAGEGAGGRVIKSTCRCCSSIGELSDHATYAFTARRLSLPRFFCNFALSFQFSKFGRGRTPRTKHRRRTPRTNSHRGRTLFLFRSLGALPVTDRGRDQGIEEICGIADQHKIEMTTRAKEKTDENNKN